MKASSWVTLFTVAGFSFLIGAEVEEEKISVVAEVSEDEIIVRIKNGTSKVIEVPTYTGRMIVTFWILSSTKGASYAPKEYAAVSADGGFAPDLFSKNSITPGGVMNSKFRFDELVLETEQVEAFRFLVEPHSRNRILVEFDLVVENEIFRIFRPCWARK